MFDILILCHCKVRHRILKYTAGYNNVYYEGELTEPGFNVKYLDIACDESDDQYVNWDSINEKFDLIWAVHCPIYGSFKQPREIIMNIIKYKILKKNGKIVIPLYMKSSEEKIVSQLSVIPYMPFDIKFMTSTNYLEKEGFMIGGSTALLVLTPLSEYLDWKPFPIRPITFQKIYKKKIKRVLEPQKNAAKEKIKEKANDEAKDKIIKIDLVFAVSIKSVSILSFCSSTKFKAFGTPLKLNQSLSDVLGVLGVIFPF